VRSTRRPELQLIAIELDIRWRRLSQTATLSSMFLRVEQDDFSGWVTLLGDPIRARGAYWHLLGSGEAALPAIRNGLQDTNADVRMYCAKVLDHLVDEDSYPVLVAMLDDPDDRVRWDTLHALACDRCKETTCRPDKADVLPRAVQMLRGDPSRHVRAIAVEVVGRWVHTDQTAVDALLAARDGDPEPSVRKKAGWYAPGGTIHRKTQPKKC
jgi:HEAT repeat protein